MAVIRHHYFFHYGRVVFIMVFTVYQFLHDAEVGVGLIIVITTILTLVIDTLLFWHRQGLSGIHAAEIGYGDGYALLLLEVIFPLCIHC